MQAYDDDNKPISDITPFEEAAMKKLLDIPEVDHVKVFRLKKGDILNIKGTKFEVTKVMNSGRAVIKRRT